ncbi:hypothetical protein D3C76_1091300 [compost metagenome]
MLNSENCGSLSRFFASPSIAPAPPMACSGVILSSDPKVLSRPAAFGAAAMAPSPCSPWLPCIADTTLAASLRLNCAKAGLAASVNRQDRAKPRETFIRDFLLSMKKPLIESGVKRALDWCGRRLFLNVLQEWPIAITESSSKAVRSV